MFGFCMYLILLLLTLTNHNNLILLPWDEVRVLATILL